MSGDTRTGAPYFSARLIEPHGEIFVQDLRAAPGDAEPRVLQRVGGPAKMQPHGIHVLTRAHGRPLVFVVAHYAFSGEEDSIEIYERDGAVLRHRYSVRHPLIRLMNDVVAVSEEEFYATNFLSYPSETLLQHLCTYSLLGFNYVIGCRRTADGTAAWQCDKVAESLIMANGITTLHNRSLVVVAETLGARLSVFRRDPASMALDPVGRIDVHSACDNLNYDAERDVIWAGCHPKVLKFPAHAADRTTVSPTQVKWIKIAPDGRPRAVGESVYHDGRVVSGSSAADRYENDLLVGFVFAPGLWRCPLARADTGSSAPE